MEDVAKLRCEALVDFSEKNIQAILSLESLFPEKIKEGKEKVVEELKDPENIKIVMLNEHNVIVGYALAIPHNEAIKELYGDDPLMEPDSSRFYIDKIALVPDLRKGLLFLKLVDAIFVQARKQNVHCVSSHILCENKLDKIISLIYRNRITKKRYVYLPSYGENRFMYVEVKFE